MATESPKLFTIDEILALCQQILKQLNSVQSATIRIEDQLQELQEQEDF